MSRTEFRAPQRQWTKIAEGRECGSCYACCVWLGIEELKKYTGQTCKHLNGNADPCKRCSIYADRPKACSEYKCLWRTGIGPEELRPADSGVLITPYPSEEGAEIAFTVIVFDRVKAKPWITKIISELMQIHPDVELRFINIETMRGLHFTNGAVYDIRLMPSRGYESLDFARTDKPVAKFRLEDIS